MMDGTAVIYRPGKSIGPCHLIQADPTGPQHIVNLSRNMTNYVHYPLY